MDASTDTKTDFKMSQTEIVNTQSPCRSPFDTTDRSSVNVRGMKWTLGKLENIAVGLNVFALLASISIVGTSGDTLAVYHQTSNQPDSDASLWPNDFTLQPTITFVACGAVSLFLNLVSLYGTFVSSYNSKLRARPMIQSIITCTCAMIALGVTIIAVGIFYNADRSDTTWTYKSWSCQWKDAAMSSAPHWNTMCTENKAALYLTILLLPVELLSLVCISLGARRTKELRRAAIAEERLTIEKLDAEAISC